jgi:hypothetical protein
MSTEFRDLDTMQVGKSGNAQAHEDGGGISWKIQKLWQHMLHI